VEAKEAAKGREETLYKAALQSFSDLDESADADESAKAKAFARAKIEEAEDALRAFSAVNLRNRVPVLQLEPVPGMASPSQQRSVQRIVGPATEP